MEELIYVDRRNSNCNKWDGQTAMFGEEGLHAMWVEVRNRGCDPVMGRRYGF